MKAALAVAAVLLTPLNCLAAVGLPWRTLARFAVEHRIPIVHIGRRPAIRVDLLLAAVEGRPVQVHHDEAEIIRLAAGGRR